MDRTILSSLDQPLSGQYQWTVSSFSPAAYCQSVYVCESGWEWRLVFFCFIFESFVFIQKGWVFFIIIYCSFFFSFFNLGFNLSRKIFTFVKPLVLVSVLTSCMCHIMGEDKNPGISVSTPTLIQTAILSRRPQQLPPSLIYQNRSLAECSPQS